MLIFAKIDYINLLPLHIYLKKAPLPSAFKQILEYKKGVPSALNKALFYRRIDGAFISSIESARSKYKRLDLGICAHKRVKSVLVKKHSQAKFDSASASSNALARALGVSGEVLIGDRALKEYLKKPSDFIDLCELWHSRTHLPFVFARFSCIKNKHFFEKILKNFTHQKVFIPGFILHKYALSRGISAKDIKDYLKEIYYKIEGKEKRALKLFLRKSKETR